ncbi:steroid 17-alpha-hydroxylase/17,20 lyase-like [Dendronephthya gigantea]|uniref:steroid 17-alpha-hydroxylase/17,20 lyase-like n=1 Tax=Dendronephthya gigantea TaxID=151771 RepID=UPI00106BF799|nr:steroid 17-alpha-hydroxylase/17,20 lyase-like [Dendronephthya gigantea]
MALHTFGEGKKIVHENVNDQLDEFSKAVESLNCQPFDPLDIFESSIISILYRWITGKTNNLKDDLQKKLQNEIDEVLLGDEVLQWKDMSKLPYLQATVCEVMRHSYFVPLSLPHNPVIETQLQGYRIPKETTIFFNYHCIHRDENVWKNPSVFNPDRFIDENGKFVGWRVKPGFMPFGIGSRSCPGENLSRAEIMFFISGILKRYKFEVNEDDPMPTLERGKAAGKFPPKPFKVIARKRE